MNDDEQHEAQMAAICGGPPIAPTGWRQVETRPGELIAGEVQWALESGAMTRVWIDECERVHATMTVGGRTRVSVPPPARVVVWLHDTLKGGREPWGPDDPMRHGARPDDATVVLLRGEGS